MVLMINRSKKREPGEDSKAVDCRTCLHYPNPNTTGKSEDLLTKTNDWTQSFCGEDECKDKTYTSIDKQEDSVVKGDPDGNEEKKDTDNS